MNKKDDDREDEDMLAIKNTNETYNKVTKRDLKDALKKGNKKYNKTLEKLAK